MKLFNDLYNRWLLKKHHVQYKSMPEIDGRLMIAMFADSGHFVLGENVVINSGIKANPVGGFKTVLLIKGNGAKIEIDDNTGISNAIICAKQSIYIGKNVNLGAGCRIFDTDFHSIDLEERLADVNIPCKPVRIEDGAFIGSCALIMKGVTIGECSVIGADSVVTKSVPAGEIWAGNPAKFIKKL